MTPTTLPALRAAVARVLVVAGQREAVVTVTTAPCGWSPWHPDDADITVAVTLTTTGRILERRGRDEAHAVARLWEAVLDAVWARAADTRRQRVLAERRGAPPEECAALRGEETRAAAALAVALLTRDAQHRAHAGTRDEAAAALGVRRSTLAAWVRGGWLSGGSGRG